MFGSFDGFLDFFQDYYGNYLNKCYKGFFKKKNFKFN